MTTNYIDASLHVASVPSTYIVPGLLASLGATVATVLPGNVVMGPDSDHISGNFTSAGNATIVALGFVPTHIQIFNETDGLQWEWLQGMSATKTIKYTDATPAIATDTNSQIVVTADLAGGKGDVGYVTLGATLCGTSKNIVFRMEA